MKVKSQVNGVQTKNRKGKTNESKAAKQLNSIAGVTKNVITSKKKQKNNLQNGKKIKIQPEVAKVNDDTIKVVSPNVLKTTVRKRNRKHKKKSGELSAKNETQEEKVAVVTNKMAPVKIQLKKKNKVKSGELSAKNETQEGKVAVVTNKIAPVKIQLKKKNKVNAGGLSPKIVSDKKSPAKGNLKIQLKKKNRRKKSKAGKQQVINETVIVEKDTILESPISTDSDASSEDSDNLLNESVPTQSKKIRNDVDDENTIFVGNLPITVKPKAVEQYFKKYGKIISVRLRNAAQSDQRINKKVAIIKQQFHKDANSINAFVNFDEKFQARNALEANGSLFEGHHIRVDYAKSENQHNQRVAIFVGNLPFAVEDDVLWKTFENCGEIESVRIIRDKDTRIGKGFGYVNFKSPDGVELALQLEDVTIQNRKLRIARAADPKTGQQSNTKVNRKIKSKKRKLSESQNNDNVEKKQRSIENEAQESSKKKFQGAKSAERRIKKQTLKKKVKKMRNEKHKKAVASILTSKSGKGLIHKKKNKEAKNK